MKDIDKQAFSPDDLCDEDQRAICEIVGTDKFLAIVALFGGSNVYIPKLQSLSLEKRNEAIRAKYNGHNLKQLKREFGLCNVTIRKVLGISGKRVGNDGTLPPDKR
jgi:Mor family transcriptional regulator